MNRGTVLRLLAIAALLAVSLAACTPPEEQPSGNARGPAKVPDMPSEPVAIDIIDVAGNLALTKGMIERYADEHPEMVADVTYTEATSPELAGKVKAQQDAGRVDIDLVLTGTDGLSAGVEQDLWLKLLPNYNVKFPNLTSNYTEPAADMQELAQDYGITVTYYPSGPLIEYNPEAIPDPPKTADDLLAWAKDNPEKFQYARPANSGPGRTFLMGLPYILGDDDPKDPRDGWDKTWAYLEELGKYIEYYPSGTTDTMEELADGTRDMIATTTGWDINPRVLGTVPKDVEVGTIEGFHWVTDAHYMVVPRGIEDGNLAVVLDLMSYMLEPEQQALAYDDGYFYPGPAVEGVTLDMAPESSQKAIEEYGRSFYDELIESVPTETPLETADLVYAFERWDREIGGSKIKEE